MKGGKALAHSMPWKTLQPKGGGGGGLPKKVPWPLCLHLCNHKQPLEHRSPISGRYGLYCPPWLPKPAQAAPGTWA